MRGDYYLRMDRRSRRMQLSNSPFFKKMVAIIKSGVVSYRTARYYYFKHYKL